MFIKLTSMKFELIGERDKRDNRGRAFYRRILIDSSVEFALFLAKYSKGPWVIRVDYTIGNCTTVATVDFTDGDLKMLSMVYTCIISKIERNVEQIKANPKLLEKIIPTQFNEWNREEFLNFVLEGLCNTRSVENFTHEQLSKIN
jgi:hypothetical protein